MDRTSCPPTSPGSNSLRNGTPAPGGDGRQMAVYPGLGHGLLIPPQVRQAAPQTNEMARRG